MSVVIKHWSITVEDNNKVDFFELKSKSVKENILIISLLYQQQQQ